MTAELRLWKQTPWSIRKTLAAAGKRAGLAPFCVHDLRRTFTTRAASAGYPMPMLKDILGQTSMETTSAYYVHADRAERARLLARLNLGSTPQRTQKGTQSAALNKSNPDARGRTRQFCQKSATMESLPRYGSGRRAAW